MSRGARCFSDPPATDWRELDTIRPPPSTACDRSGSVFTIQICLPRLSNDECARVAKLVLEMVEGRA